MSSHHLTQDRPLLLSIIITGLGPRHHHRRVCPSFVHGSTLDRGAHASYHQSTTTPTHMKRLITSRGGGRDSWLVILVRVPVSDRV